MIVFLKVTLPAANIDYIIDKREMQGIST